MSTLYKRKKSSFWQCRTDPVTGSQVSTGCRTKAAAQEWLKAREFIAANPAHHAANEATLGKWVERVNAEKRRRRSEGTQKFYEQKCAHLIRFFGKDAPMSSITPGSVDDYTEQRRIEGAAHYTVSKEFTALRQVLKRASRAGEYNRDIATVFPPEFGLGYTPRVRVLMPDEEPKLKEKLGALQWAASCFIISTGARFGELMRAKPEDYDPEDHSVHLHGTKTKGADCVIPIIGDVFADYWTTANAWLLQHGSFEAQRISKDLGEAAKKAGIPHLSANDLRRTCATRLIEAGADPYLVSKITRHTDLQMLRKVYDQSSMKKVRAAISAQIRVQKEEKPA